MDAERVDAYEASFLQSLRQGPHTGAVPIQHFQPRAVFVGEAEDDLLRAPQCAAGKSACVSCLYFNLYLTE